MLDIKDFLDKIAPEKEYYHNSEGPDDMPAHLKSLLTQTNLTISEEKYSYPRHMARNFLA